MLEVIQKPFAYYLRFNWNKAIIDDIKAIKPWQDRSYVPEEKMWSVSIERKNEVLQIIEKHGGKLIEQTESEKIGDIPPMPELNIEIATKIELRHYQKQGVAYGLEKKRFINGDKPGLGKTAEAIATVFAAQAFPVLCIVPASLRDNWVKEWNKVVGIKAMILEDRVKKTWPTFYTVGMCNVFITSYDSLEKYFVEKINKDEKGKWKISNVVFNKNKDIFKAVIIDEIQKIKDSKTRAAKLTAGICFQKEYRIGLSGTPILNTPKDLVSQLKTIGQLEAVGGSYKYFINRYCGGDGKGATNLKELNYRLKTACFFQRTTEEVLTELPPKIYQNVYCDITTRKEYNIALNDLSSYLKDFKDKTAREISISMRGEVMVKIGILKQISARGKMEAVTEYIEDLLGAGEKVGLFVHHAEVADFIKGKFPQTLLYTGRQSSAEKNIAVEQFQKCKSCGVMFEDHKGLDHDHEMSDKKLITISTKAGGVGLTLTAARNMGVVELPWHPADCEQIEARFWRMSQTNNVKCTYFLGRNTIDEHIYDIIERKRGVVNAVMGLDDNRQFVDKEEKNLVDNIIKLFNDGKMNVVQ